MKKEESKQQEPVLQKNGELNDRMTFGYVSTHDC